MVRAAIDTELLCTEVYVLNFKVYYLIYIIHIIINLKTKLYQGLRPARLYVSRAIQVPIQLHEPRCDNSTIFIISYIIIKYV